jgi:membrane protein
MVILSQLSMLRRTAEARSCIVDAMIPLPLREIGRDTFSAFSRHGGRVLGGAIAFYALLSVAPLLLIALHVAGLLTSQDAARAALTHDMARWIGTDGAGTLSTLLDRAGHSRSGPLATVLGATLLLYASTRLFSALEFALHQMWEVHAKSGVGFRGKALRQLRKRSLAFVLVVLIGLILVALVIEKSALAAASHLFDDRVPGVVHVGEGFASFVITTGLFAAIFRVLPEVRMRSRDLLFGAVVTSLLFSLGTSLVGLYIAHKGTSSTFGAAGSLVVLLLWVHYSAQIFFLGVAFTSVWAKRQGHPIEPTERAVRVVVEADEG